MLATKNLPVTTIYSLKAPFRHCFLVFTHKSFSKAPTSISQAVKVFVSLINSQPLQLETKYATFPTGL